MLPLLAALAIGHQDVVEYSRTKLPNPFGKEPRVLIWFQPEARLDPPKMSPKLFGEPPQPFEFDFSTFGSANTSTRVDATNFEARFRVFEQQRKPVNDVAFAVTEMLLRLWEHDRYDFLLEHSAYFDSRCVDVYLCWGGAPGGEQRFDIDPSYKKNQHVNTVYIYDLPSFTDPVEMAREVAHEYGHASLPPVGGFKTPEDWGNGYLGEKLSLLYLRDELAKGELKPQDAMGATARQLDVWVKAHVDPLVAQAASGPPDLDALGGTGQPAMDAYIGLVLYLNELLPKSEFAYLLSLMKSKVDSVIVRATDIPPVIPIALDRPLEVPLTIPASLAGKTIWIPVSDAKVVGAKVLATKDGWAQIKPTGAPLKLVNPPR